MKIQSEGVTPPAATGEATNLNHLQRKSKLRKQTSIRKHKRTHPVHGNKKCIDSLCREMAEKNREITTLVGVLGTYSFDFLTWLSAVLFDMLGQLSKIEDSAVALIKDVLREIAKAQKLLKDISGFAAVIPNPDLRIAT